MTEDRGSSKEREAQLRREKEEFMKKMGIAKQQREKQEPRDKKFNNRVVVGAPAGPDGVRLAAHQAQGLNQVAGSSIQKKSSQEILKMDSMDATSKSIHSKQ